MGEILAKTKIGFKENFGEKPKIGFKENFGFGEKTKNRPKIVPVRSWEKGENLP